MINKCKYDNTNKKNIVKCVTCLGRGKLGCDHPIHDMEEYEGFCDKCSGTNEPYTCPDCKGTGIKPIKEGNHG